MADSFQVLFDGQAADAAFYELVSSLEVEENADLPGAVEITLPIATQGPAGSEDFTRVGEDRFKPYAHISVVATPDGGTAACIFDGHVLSHKIHVDRGTTAATLRVWGQDVSCLMNLKERLHEWKDGKTDGAIANDIFQTYGIAVAGVNTEDDSPAHTEDGRTLMQRATDAQFLRDRARRNGKLFRVCCTSTPGRNTGYFFKPDLSGTADVTLRLNPPAAANVDALDLEWDIARPTQVFASVLVGSTEPQQGDSNEAGLAPLASRSLAAFAGGTDRVMEARLTTTADSAGELKQRAASLLRESGWFVKCEGETDLARLKTVLRVAKLAQVNGAGRIHSGKYLVWSVRHTITADSHRMRFVLVRNAVGGP
jgi:hypothetical protein